MKEAMLYALIAIMLGALTMVAPLMAVKLGNYGVPTSGEKNMSAFLEALDEGEETMSNLEDTKKAFEAYKVEAKEKVNKAEKAQKKAEDDARSWTCPKCETLYVTVKNVSP